MINNNELKQVLEILQLLYDTWIDVSHPDNGLSLHDKVEIYNDSFDMEFYNAKQLLRDHGLWVEAKKRPTLNLVERGV
jgi:protein tyrosine phosphatase